MMIDPPGINSTDKELCMYLRRSCEILSKLLSEMTTTIESTSQKCGEVDKKVASMWYDHEKMEQIASDVGTIQSTVAKLEERCGTLEINVNNLASRIEEIKAALEHAGIPI